MRISESKLHAAEYALFNKTNKNDGDLLTVYTGLVYVQGDPRLPKDNTYLCGIPGSFKRQIIYYQIVFNN